MGELAFLWVVLPSKGVIPWARSLASPTGIVSKSSPGPEISTSWPKGNGGPFLLLFQKCYELGALKNRNLYHLWRSPRSRGQWIWCLVKDGFLFCCNVIQGKGWESCLDLLSHGVTHTRKLLITSKGTSSITTTYGLGCHHIIGGSTNTFYNILAWPLKIHAHRMLLIRKPKVQSFI